MFKNLKFKTIFLIFVFLTITTPFYARAVSEGEIRNFFIESSRDVFRRKEIPAILYRVTNKLLIYIESDWWESMEEDTKREIRDNLYKVVANFENNSYPRVTETFGEEPKKNKEEQNRLIVLFHRMSTESGGYTNLGDQYSKYQVPTSNEGNVVYLNAYLSDNPIINYFLAHELIHLITFEQKRKINGDTEEVWLNEARAEYIESFIGYNNFENSNLIGRKAIFLRTPSSSLTNWTGFLRNYGVVNIFAHYLADHYGVEIFTDSLKSKSVGVQSINSFLEKNKFREDFNQVFINWTVAVLMNDCRLGGKYCYRNEDLRDLKITPIEHFLPISYGSFLSGKKTIEEWAGSWHKIIGGNGDLLFQFEGDEKANFNVTYILCDNNDSCSVKNLPLDSLQRGEITVPAFNKKYSAFYFIPSVIGKTTGSNGQSPEYTFSWRALSVSSQEDFLLKQQLLQEIADLKAEIDRIRALKVEEFGSLSCSTLNEDLFFGSKSNNVKCLQEFLKTQEDVYPEGLITGNFLNLTQSAVIRFQEKYANEILSPLGLKKGTGYVGKATRKKINELIALTY